MSDELDEYAVKRLLEAQPKGLRELIGATGTKESMQVEREPQQVSPNLNNPDNAPDLPTIDKVIIIFNGTAYYSTLYGFTGDKV